MFLRMFQHLLPNSKAWRITAEKRLRQFFQGLANANESIVDFANDVYFDLFPATTRELTEWEKQFNITVGNNPTETDRRNRLLAEWQSTGGQTPAYLQAVLRSAGFDVYVHDYFAPGAVHIAPARNVVSSVVSPSYILKNGDTVSTPLMIAACGEPLMQCGEYSAQCGYFDAFLLTTEYIDPASINPTKYPYFMYIGASVFPNRASVAASRRAEFEALILKICPAHLYKSVLVNYV